jgi:tight adherence protein C
MLTPAIFLFLGGLILFVAVILAAMGLKPSEAPSIGKRLEGLQAQKAGGVKTLRDADEMNKSFIVRVVLPMSLKLSRYFSAITPQGMIEKTRKDIAAAGLTGKVQPVQITTLSWVGMITLPTFFYFLTGAGKTERTMTDWFLVGIAFLAGWRVPIGVIQGKANKRRHEIQKALPFTLDLISISVEAGMAFDQSMAIVAEKTRGPLTDELNITLREIRLGKARNEALLDLGQRTDVEDLRTFLTAVTYIARLGGSLVDVIRIQANAMRIKRRQRAEEKAMKTPVKIMIPLVLFIFPSMFIVILGPAAIQLMEQMTSVPGQ